MPDHTKQKIRAVLCTVLFELCVLRCSWLVMELVDGKSEQSPVMTAELFVVSVIGFASLLAVRQLNRLYDRSFGPSVNIMSFGPWGMTAILIAFLVVQVMMLYYALQIAVRYGTVHTADVFRTVVLVMLDALAVKIYVTYYDFLRSRMERIERLIAKGSIHNTRRFYQLVEETGEDHMCTGEVHGTVRKNDEMNILLPGLHLVKAKIGRIRIDGNETNEAKDCMASVEPVMEDGGVIRGITPFTVLTDIMPCAYLKREVHAENPRLTAMLAEYDRFHESDNYMSTFVYDICHTEYIVPTSGKLPIHDITDAAGENSGKYFSVPASGSGNLRSMAVFTCWSAVRDFDEAVHTPAAACSILSFHEIIGILPRTFSGITVNPADRSSYYISRDMIDLITGLEGYQEEFGKA